MADQSHNSWPIRFLTGATAGFVTTLVLAHYTGPVAVTHWILLGVGLLVVLPVLMSLALFSVGLLLCAVLVALAAAGRVLDPGRPSGLAPLLRDVLALGLKLLPEYLAALRRFRRPALWGSAAGIALAGLGLISQTVL